MKNPLHKLPLLIRLRVLALRGLAGLYLMAENISRTLWPFSLWCATFASLWMLQMPQWFGLVTEIIVALIFLAGAGYWLWRGIASLHLPRHGDITRRIEQDNHLSHRPLSGLEDSLANPARHETRRLWSLWQGRLHPALLSLQWPRLRGVLPQRDPYAVRAFVLCLLLVSSIVAGGTWDTRLRHGLAPFSPDKTAVPSENVILWIIPPAYTNKAQITLKGFGKKDQPVSIPEGSIIKARVNGWPGTPELLFGDTAYPMDSLGKGSYGIEKPVENASTLAIRQILIPRSRWAMTFIPDLPPSITATGEPEIQPRGEIILPLQVRDDYSVETLTTTINLDKTVDNTAMGAPFTETRTVMSPAATAMDFKPEFDLAWHPWAGQPVTVALSVTDHKGQSASIPDLKITLPERAFRHPAARKLVELRKRLIWTPEAASRNVMHDLETIMAQPDAYHQDHIVFLALRSASARLFYTQGNRQAIAEVIALLWDTALRIEDGNFSISQRNLRDAQKTLQDALKNPDTTPGEIAVKMEQLRMAMSHYMQEMFRELQKQAAESGSDMPMMSPETMMQHINPEDIAAFLDKMQAEALGGDRNSAREMLAQMERMMDMLDPAAMQMSMPQDMKDMMESSQKIQDLIERQKALLADTQAKAGTINQQQSYSQPLPPNAELMKQWGMTDLPPPPQVTRRGDAAPKRNVDMTGNKTEQDSIRQGLGDVMLDMSEKRGNIPDNIARADLAMRSSAIALNEGNPADSIPNQEEAIRSLSEGQQQLSQQLARRMKQMMMFSFGMGGRTDPLGRPMDDGEGNNPWSASKIKIPDKAERRRVQEILEELRKKSGELQRPVYELDYYRRLMRQF